MNKYLVALKAWFAAALGGSVFNNPKKVVYAIVTFVLLFILALATKCHAAESSYMSIRGGVTAIRGPTQVLELSLSTPVPDGSGGRLVSDARLEYGVLLIGTSTYTGCDKTTTTPPSSFIPDPGFKPVTYCAAPVGEQTNQAAGFVRYVDGYGPIDIGLGLVAMQHEDAYNSGRLNFNLMLGYHHGRFSVRLNHISNAGSSRPNLGRDMVLVGWSFK
jgi:hypothetical protein